MKIQNQAQVISLVAVSFFAMELAHAHPGHSGSLIEGFVHPFAGIDHILAMLAVGLLGSKFGGRSLWVLPTIFVTLMNVGGLWNYMGGSLPFLEQWIVASVFIFGLLIASPTKTAKPMSLTLVGLFAIFHGNAHFSEMNSNSHFPTYILGFLFSTVVLHGIGLCLGFLLRSVAGGRALRLSGTVIATCGFLVLLD